MHYAFWHVKECESGKEIERKENRKPKENGKWTGRTFQAERRGSRLSDTRAPCALAMTLPFLAQRRRAPTGKSSEWATHARKPYKPSATSKPLSRRLAQR